MNAGTVIMKKRREIIRKFREAGATSPACVKTLQELGLSWNPILEIQKRQGILMEAEPGRFYLDEAREAEISRKRRIWIACGIAIIALFAWLASRA